MLENRLSRNKNNSFIYEECRSQLKKMYDELDLLIKKARSDSWREFCSNNDLLNLYKINNICKF